MTWLRLHLDIRNDPKLITLAPSDRWYYVAILTMKADGTLDNFLGENLEKVIRTQLRLTAEEASETRSRLREIGLIDSRWQPTGWNARQYLDSSAEESARRSKEYRARKSVTPPSRDSSRDASVSVSEVQESLPESEEDSSSSSFLEDIKKAYPRGIHNSLRMTTVHEIYSLNNIGQRKIVLDGVKRYAASVRAQNNEGTKYVMSINTFFTNELWKAEWPLPEKKKEDGAENDDKESRARAREMLEKMERGELDEF